MRLLPAIVLALGAVLGPVAWHLSATWLGGAEAPAPATDPDPARASSSAMSARSARTSAASAGSG
ncbi:MAG: hypothetical protein AAFZ09_15735, partial [Pseudomonadota bacterium]